MNDKSLAMDDTLRHRLFESRKQTPMLDVLGLLSGSRHFEEMSVAVFSKYQKFIDAYFKCFYVTTPAHRMKNVSYIHLLANNRLANATGPLRQVMQAIRLSVFNLSVMAKFCPIRMAFQQNLRGTFQRIMMATIQRGLTNQMILLFHNIAGPRIDANGADEREVQPKPVHILAFSNAEDSEKNPLLRASAAPAIHHEYRNVLEVMRVLRSFSDRQTRMLSLQKMRSNFYHIEKTARIYSKIKRYLQADGFDILGDNSAAGQVISQVFSRFSQHFYTISKLHKLPVIHVKKDGTENDKPSGQGSNSGSTIMIPFTERVFRKFAQREESYTDNALVYTYTNARHDFISLLNRHHELHETELITHVTKRVQEETERLEQKLAKQFISPGKLTDRVYHRLTRQLQIEKERVGF